VLDRSFDRVAVKVLTAVETDIDTSNQHELNGINGFKELLGPDRREQVPCDFHYLTDDPTTDLDESGFVSWYDSREAHQTRSEYRLYYSANKIFDTARVDDLLVLADRGSSIDIFVAQAGSSTAQQLIWLLGITMIGTSSRVHRTSGLIDRSELVAHLPLFDRLGLVPSKVHEIDLEELFDSFPDGLPTTADFAKYARELHEPDLADDPDMALLTWTRTEEQMFRSIERSEIAERLDTGFHGPEGLDVDGFLSYSLSIQNRRKSRAGHSLEHHLRALLDHVEAPYAHGAITEGMSRPDFLFPSATAYHDLTFPVDRLLMLAVKTTCKDRWRQVLAEAERIPEKHLLTLEPAISQAQTDEMKRHQLQLVVPHPLHDTYRSDQCSWLMPVANFLALVT